MNGPAGSGARTDNGIASSSRPLPGGAYGAVQAAAAADSSVFSAARERLRAGAGAASSGALSARAGAQQLVPYLSSVNNNVNNMFTMSVQDICPLIREVSYMSTGVACLAMSRLEASMKDRRAPGAPVECPDRRETGFGKQVVLSGVPGPNGGAAPAPFADMRPVPQAFPYRTSRELMEREGGTWAWLWAGISNVLDVSLCAKGAGGRLDYYVPDGWAPVGPGSGLMPGVYSLRQSDGSPSMPFMAVMKTVANYSDPEGGPVPVPQLVVVMRGTNSGPEWIIDFAYHKFARSVFPGRAFPGNSFEGETHAGFTAVFNALWPIVRAALEREVVSESGPRIGHVAFAGHSLGAAVATLLSYAAQRYLDHRRPGVVVDALLVASPNVGDEVFARSFASVVNSRRIMFINDVITQVPCTGGAAGRGMPACHAVDTEKAVGSNPVQEDKQDAEWITYHDTYGEIVTDGSMLPVQSVVWQRTDKLPVLDRVTSDALTGAIHVCSYDCFFSQWAKAGPKMMRSSCLLVPASTQKELHHHTFCPGFPTPGFE